MGEAQEYMENGIGRLTKSHSANHNQSCQRTTPMYRAAISAIRVEVVINTLVYLGREEDSGRLDV